MIIVGVRGLEFLVIVVVTQDSSPYTCLLTTWLSALDSRLSVRFTYLLLCLNCLPACLSAPPTCMYVCLSALPTSWSVCSTYLPFYSTYLSVCLAYLPTLSVCLGHSESPVHNLT